LLQLVAEIAIKTTTNYTNHPTHTPLDDVFASAKWTKSEA